MMQHPPLLLQLLTYLTAPPVSNPNPRHLLLLARYHHPNHMPLLADILALIFSPAPFNTRQPLHLPRVLPLIKQLIIGADLYTTLIFVTKLQPFLSGKGFSEPARQALQKGYREWVLHGLSAAQKKYISIELLQVRREVAALLEWFKKMEYFEFYLNLLNQPAQKCQEHVQSLLLQISSDYDLPLSLQEVQYFRNELLTQCDKLAKRDYREQTTKCIYQWLQSEVKEGFGESTRGGGSLLSSEALSRLVRTGNNLAEATLVHVMESAIGQVLPIAAEKYLALVDEIMICGSGSTAVHACVILASSIFIKIVNKELVVAAESAIKHFQLWKHSMDKRQMPSKLLMCLAEWLSLLLGQHDSEKQLGQALQLFRVQLGQMREESRLVALKQLIEEMEMRKIEAIYEQLIPFHSQLQRSSSVKSKVDLGGDKGKKVSFKFQVSEMSSKGELNSMIQSLKSSKSGGRSPATSTYPQQLQIYSKRHSMSNTNKEQSSSNIEHIEIILNLVDLLNFRSSTTANPSKVSSSSISSYLHNIKTPFLPIFSSQSYQRPQPSQLLSEDTISDMYGLKLRKKVSTVEIKPFFVPIRESIRKKVLKSRGVVIKTHDLQIDYFVDSHNNRRIVTIFVTFFKPIPSARVSIKQNSVRFWKQLDFLFQYPKINEQLRAILEVEGVKLYALEGLDKPERYVRPKLQIITSNNEEQEMKEVHELPVYLYNLMEWMEISEKQLPFFQEKPEMVSSWQLFCPRIIKDRQSQLAALFPHLKTDQKGNILLKLRFLLQVVLAKVYIVQDRCRVVLINCRSEEVLRGVLQVVCSEEVVRE